MEVRASLLLSLRVAELNCFSGTNANNMMLRLILLDVNDNAPQMPELHPVISESAQIGDKVVSEFYAPDIDDPNTPNARVEYRIVSVVAGMNIIV